MPEPTLRRRDRRVVLALLTGADNLSGYPLARAAQVSAVRVYRVLDRLQDADYVTATWTDVTGLGEDGVLRQRRCYRLTSDGRVWAHRTLGLTPAHEPLKETPQ
ncbi:PadR family transcriptional regulator [Actinomadura luteofluorescens]|uniref:PadR family transcriptional regulator n=1 Tax=Actinomadura luteofluorescens TaxID=46163 RepID=UPI003D9345C1